MKEVIVNGHYTLFFATLVLLLGGFLVKRIKALEHFSIPEPVAGGLVAAVIIYALNAFLGYSFVFSGDLKNAFMLIFYASIGLSADFSRLKAGGVPLVIFTLVVSVFIVLQNGVGVALANMLGLEPLMGLVLGSIPLTGGHGTAGAWGATLEEKYQLVGATTLGIAAATYGLVAGGVIGGPVAKRLIDKKLKLQPANVTGDEQINQADKQTDKKSDIVQLITANATIKVLVLFAMCLVFADVMTTLAKGSKFELPTFVWALAGGVIIRNVSTLIFKGKLFDHAIDVFGDASLSLFLAIALLDLKLWQLTALAVPVLVILLVQTVVMILYAYFVTFWVMGKNYDAAVLSAGHCGFGLGATPTAIANMQAITNRYLPSHKAFLVVPMVGAFFVDIINTAIIQGFIELM